MGLDIVGIFMDVEDEFNIILPENAYTGLQTVGHLHSCVLNQIIENNKQINEDNQLFEAIQKLPKETSTNNLRDKLSFNHKRPDNFNQLSDSVYNKIVHIISNVTGWDKNEIKPDTMLTDLMN
jgi:acyl carrier protein